MTQDDFQKQVLDRLDALNNDVEQISKVWIVNRLK